MPATAGAAAQAVYAGGMALRHEAGSVLQPMTRTLWLRPAPESVAVARGALAGLEQELEPGLFMDVSLCVSELVTSAIGVAQPSAGETLELRVSSSGGVVSASVQDHGPAGEGAERRTPPAADDDLGLHIISRLADRFGVDPAGRRRWLEFRQLAGGSRERSSAFGPGAGN